jgi:hypothetical protein
VVFIVLYRVLKRYPLPFAGGLRWFLVVTGSSIRPLVSRGGIFIVSESLVTYEKVAGSVSKLNYS